MKNNIYKYVGVYYRPKDPRFPPEVRQDCYVLQYSETKYNPGTGALMICPLIRIEFNHQSQANRALKKMIKKHKIETI